VLPVDFGHAGIEARRMAQGKALRGIRQRLTSATNKKAAEPSPCGLRVKMNA